jgi:transcriptional regulator with XRE-family HTH domain
LAGSALLVAARRAAGLSQDALARRAATSRPTLSAYEHGRKVPSLATVERILEATGFELTLTPHIEFVEHPTRRGRMVAVPSHLPRLPFSRAFATVRLPLHLNWSDPGREFALADRRQRARVYEMVLREGTAEDILTYIDGALLVDLWKELVLPPDIREAWAPAIEGDLGA